MKINKKDWQEFKFDNIFTITRGKRLVKIDQITGNIAYISSSKKNNGVNNYILPPRFMKIYKNALTLNNSGSVGYCFYHPYKFVASDHCTIIQIKNKKIKLYHQKDHYMLWLPLITLFFKKYIYSKS